MKASNSGNCKISQVTSVPEESIQLGARNTGSLQTELKVRMEANENSVAVTWDANLWPTGIVCEK